jgi:hypothetical protein
MARKIIVVTAAYGHDRLQALGGQRAVLPVIAAAGADGVEIRRELFTPQDIDALPLLGADIAQHSLLACYSAPEALFEADGSLNPRLHALLREAKALNALWLKLSLGNFIWRRRWAMCMSKPRSRITTAGVPCRRMPIRAGLPCCNPYPTTCRVALSSRSRARIWLPSPGVTSTGYARSKP